MLLPNTVTYINSNTVTRGKKTYAVTNNAVTVTGPIRYVTLTVRAKPGIILSIALPAIITKVARFNIKNNPALKLAVSLVTPNVTTIGALVTALKARVLRAG